MLQRIPPCAPLTKANAKPIRCGPCGASATRSLPRIACRPRTGCLQLARHTLQCARGRDRVLPRRSVVPGARVRPVVLPSSSAPHLRVRTIGYPRCEAPDRACGTRHIARAVDLATACGPASVNPSEETTWNRYNFAPKWRAILTACEGPCRRGGEVRCSRASTEGCLCQYRSSPRGFLPANRPHCGRWRNEWRPLQLVRGPREQLELCPADNSAPYSTPALARPISKRPGSIGIWLLQTTKSLSSRHSGKLAIR